MNDTVTAILSIIGAAAWLPVIFHPIINIFRKMQITPLDHRILTNAFGVSADKRQKKKGTILMLVINIYINKMTIFAKTISARIILNNGTELKTELLDFSTLISDNDDNTTSYFDVNEKEEFNISRTIYSNVDNIKYVAFLVESGIFANIDEVKEIILVVKYGKILTKEVKIKREDFPKFNSSRLIEKYEKVKRAI